MWALFSGLMRLSLRARRVDDNRARSGSTRGNLHFDSANEVRIIPARAAAQALRAGAFQRCAGARRV
jgi:hypothetical protein